MTAEKKGIGASSSVQEHCIDLPGESVQCWVGGKTEKLKVILRKHRDVVFDICLGDGKIYTLEAPESDFYSQRDKKIILSSRKDETKFKDGERFHIWISRDFKGSLLLKSDGEIKYKINPSLWDIQKYGNDPKEKPAPIIFSVSNATQPSSSNSRENQPITKVDPKPSFIASKSSPVSITQKNLSDDLCPVICVIDGKVDGMPAHIVEYFAKGGGESGFADIDPNHVATRNWIWGQIAGTGAYVKDNWDWLRASLDGKASQGFRLVQARVHYVQGKVRFYFSGYSNSNTFFGRGGFGPNHSNIMSIFAGAGTTTSSFKATAKGIAGTFKGNAIVSFVFGSATSIIEWKNDISKDGYDLAATLITITVKAILAASVTTLVIALMISFIMMFAGVAVPIILVGAATIIGGILASYIIDAGDQKLGRHLAHGESSSDGTSTHLASWMRNIRYSAQERIQINWNYLIYRMSSDYKELVL